MSPLSTQKLEQEILKIKRDLAILKAAVLTSDPEGNYRQDFVKEVKAAAKESPTKIYSAGDFTI